MNDSDLLGVIGERGGTNPGGSMARLIHYENFGAELERLRTDNLLSKQEISDKLNLSIQVYTRIVSGETGGVQRKTLRSVISGAESMGYVVEFDEGNNLIRFTKRDTGHIAIPTDEDIQNTIDAIKALPADKRRIVVSALLRNEAKELGEEIPPSDNKLERGGL